MWDNNVRPDGRTNNHSIISLEGRYHKIEDYNNALTDENKHLKLKLKDVTNQTNQSTRGSSSHHHQKKRFKLDSDRSIDSRDGEDSLTRTTRNFAQFSGEL